MNTSVFENAVLKIRNGIPQYMADSEVRGIVDSRDTVIGYFQQIFSPQHLPELTADEFKSFLLFKNNQHWGGIHRQGSDMVSDIEKLRKALLVLVDEKKPVDQRLDDAISAVKGLGRAVATAILLISQPSKYGVWNNTSEGGLKALELWPTFGYGASPGTKYVTINEVLLKLATDVNTDLWSLDAYLYAIVAGRESEAGPVVAELPGSELEVSAPPCQTFGLERHLHDFLRDNWSRTELGRDWDIFSEVGGPEAGYEYPTSIGRIDLLCRHKKEPRWLVIELKRQQTGDSTVGQVLRYMGWVKGKLAAQGEQVRGLVIAHSADDGLKYALDAVPDVDLQLYEVEFRLRPATGPMK